jgi:hypothetical protein
MNHEIRPGKLSEQVPLWEASHERRIKALHEFMMLTDVDLARREVEKVVRGRLSQEIGFGAHHIAEIDKKVAFVSCALQFADEKFRDEGERLTGGPAILHSYGVAYLTALDPEITLDKLHQATAEAGCHDILEDTRTYPRELVRILGHQGTGNVLALSYGIRVFEENPAEQTREIKRIKKIPKPTPYDLALARWNEIERSDRDTMLQSHVDWVNDLEDHVGRIRVYDKAYNLRTMPKYHDPNRPEQVNKQAKKMWSRIDEARKYILQVATAVGLGEVLKKSIRYAHDKRRSQDKNKPA